MPVMGKASCASVVMPIACAWVFKVRNQLLFN